MLWGRGRGNRTLNWQSIGLQNRRLGVRFPLPLPQSIFQWFSRCRFALAILALSLNDLKTIQSMGNSCSSGAVHTTGGKAMLVLAALLALLGIFGFYTLSSHGAFMPTASLAGGLIAGGGVALFSPAGKEFICFTKDSWREVRKVVWPTRQEAGQTTLVVFGFVLVMAIYIWFTD